ncbi:MAG TPA: geranylgeranyl reductase family protein [Chryseolinea sp.]|nr:geranylgeranyl reductase family protein [Chryseolinea sp.]
MSTRKFDVVIVGAGPAGAATAIALGNSGLAVAVLDKAKFPRDKTCGDALSVDVINQLKILSPLLLDDFEEFRSKVTSYGVKIFAPDGNSLDIPFVLNDQKRSGYVCTRLDFDSLLVRHLSAYPNVEVFEDHAVDRVENTGEQISIHSGDNDFSAPIVIGADGAHSIVAKTLGKLRPDKDHYSAGLRVYCEGITGFHPQNFIELYFFQQILPGYLWIFPLPDNTANVGIGMLSSAISKKKINLKSLLHELLSTHPALQSRFRNAKPKETVKGYGLPLGSKKRVLSGDRFLLTGDAASLIDPFSGEGIANAIRSGRIAAAHIIKCFQTNNFSQSFNSQYDREIYGRMWKELRLSRSLQQLCRYPRLFNFVIRKAKQNEHVYRLLIDAMAQVDKKKSLVQPGFYYRLLFKS